ncbi:hypothetical protein ES288_D11G145900v1 [Gossypium darwinii]|uniref:Uncharacterized protein n=1 Tax=Gossypium darwinii TaxID=34276 RepID=A0A5D2AJT4_GOSDA|nr:hypothetical protein ES288_D11G145900v1 [Gossypium darwinii]
MGGVLLFSRRWTLSCLLGICFERSSKTSVQGGAPFTSGGLDGSCMKRPIKLPRNLAVRKLMPVRRIWTKAQSVAMAPPCRRQPLRWYCWSWVFQPCLLGLLRSQSFLPCFRQRRWLECLRCLGFTPLRLGLGLLGLVLTVLLLWALSLSVMNSLMFYRMREEEFWTIPHIMKMELI